MHLVFRMLGKHFDLDILLSIVPLLVAVNLRESGHGGPSQRNKARPTTRPLRIAQGTEVSTELQQVH